MLRIALPVLLSVLLLPGQVNGFTACSQQLASVFDVSNIVGNQAQSGYRGENSTVINNIMESLANASAGNRDQARSLVTGVYDVCEDEMDSDILVWIPKIAGSAIIAVNVGSNADPVVAHVNHPGGDTDTYKFAELFMHANARAVVTSGTHRCATTDASGCDGTTSACGSGAAPYSFSDSAHYDETVFHQAAITLAALYPSTVAVSVHGMSKPGISVSSGVNMDVVPTAPSAKLHQALRKSISRTDKRQVTACQKFVGLHPVDYDYRYCGTTNLQGRVLNGVAENSCTTTATSAGASCRFIQMELEISLRTDSGRRNEIIGIIMDTFTQASPPDFSKCQVTYEYDNLGAGFCRAIDTGDGKYVNGMRIDGIGVESKCAAACDAYPFCVGYAYRSSDERCYVHGRIWTGDDHPKSTISTSSGAADEVCWRRDTDGSYESIGQGLCRSSDPVDDEVAGRYGSDWTEDGCKSECSKLGACGGYGFGDYGSGNTICYLYGRGLESGLGNYNDWVAYKKSNFEIDGVPSNTAGVVCMRRATPAVPCNPNPCPASEPWECTSGCDTDATCDDNLENRVHVKKGKWGCWEESSKTVMSYSSNICALKNRTVLNSNEACLTVAPTTTTPTLAPTTTTPTLAPTPPTLAPTTTTLAPTTPGPTHSPTPIEYTVVSTGNCADVNMVPIPTTTSCSSVAAALVTYNGNNVIHQGNSGNYPRPEGCYVSTFTGSMYRTTNSNNAGVGSDTSKHQVCQAPNAGV